MQSRLESVERTSSTPLPQRTKVYMNVDEACEYLGIGRSLMDKLTAQKRITYVLMGGRKFKEQWLNDYVEKNKIQAVD